MKQSILKSIFFTSMRSIGLDPSRYSHVPTNLRKKTISLDIYKSIPSSSRRSINFKANKIGELTTKQINDHQKRWNACIAMACLGNREYLKPLVSYLDFPEPRWSINTSYVLSLLTHTKNPQLHIPSQLEKDSIKEIFVKELFYTQIKDFSETLFTKNENINYFCYLKELENHASERNKNTLQKNNLSLEDDISFSKFCYSKSYSFLEKNDIHGLIYWIDKEETRGRMDFFDSCTSSIRDAINDLDISPSTRVWIQQLRRVKAKPVTSIFIFKIVAGPDKNRRLANKFVNEISHTRLNKFQTAAISDLFEQDTSYYSLRRVSRLIKSYSSLKKETQALIRSLTPAVNLFFKNALSNIYHSERESLKIVSHPKSNPLLHQTFRLTFDRFNEAFKIIIDSQDTGFESLEKMKKEIKSIHNSRLSFRKKIDENIEYKISQDYVDIFQNILSLNSRISFDQK